MNDEDELLAANAAFYAAVSSGNLEALARLWAEDDTISCVHPGWPAIVGRNQVLGSWQSIFVSGNPPQILCREPYAIVAGPEGRVLCVELLSTIALAATNVFRRVDGVWRLVHHQASEIAAEFLQVTPQQEPPSKRLH